MQIEYQETLNFDRNRYHLRVPLVVAPRYSPPPRAVMADYDGTNTIAVSDPVPDRDRLDAPVLRPEMGKTNPVTLTVNLEAGFALGDISSSSHPIRAVRNGATHAAITLDEGEVPADRDFTLSYSAAPGAAPRVSLLRENVGGDDYLLALVVPPSADARVAPKPREAIFVLDNSGSMAGESIRQAKASLLLALGRLTPADRFNVIRFDDTLTVLFPAPVQATPENVAQAKGFVAGIDANGGTEMLPALLAALNDTTPTDTTHLRQVIFLTDGDVGNEAQLFSAIDQRLGRSRLFTVGIGSAPNSYFMSGAARAGRGTYTYIGSTDEVAPRMAELFAKLERPVMTNLSAQWPNADAAETWPNPLPDLYAGEPVVLTARTANMHGKLVLSGNLNGRPWQTTLDLCTGAYRARYRAAVGAQQDRGAGRKPRARRGPGRDRQGRARRRAGASSDQPVDQSGRRRRDAAAAGGRTARQRERAAEPSRRLGFRQGVRRRTRASRPCRDCAVAVASPRADAARKRRRQRRASRRRRDGAAAGRHRLAAVAVDRAGVHRARALGRQSAAGAGVVMRRLVTILFALGAAFLAWGLYMPAKAALAQFLLERAWSRTVAGETNAKPWPWADIAPVAEIELPALGERDIVLEGASGEAMAFGPGHMPNTPPIGARGTAIVAAHRDTQFANLGRLKIGDAVVATRSDGKRLVFHVAAIRVVEADASGLDPADPGPTGARLALVTCYPFEGVLHSPLRYVVIADREAAAGS